MSRSSNNHIIVVHLQGHTLGFGSQWNATGLTDNEYNYIGENAIRVWRDWGCDGTPPVEKDGQPNDGSFGSHWDEKCLLHEFMTPLLTDRDAEIGTRISNLTIASMADLGYLVNYGAAEDYDGSDTACGCGCDPCDSSSNLYVPEANKTPLSDDGKAAAVSYGLEVLSQSERPAYLAEVDKTSGLAYVGDKMVFVLIEENGIHYDVLVTSDMEA